jgi:hypothetical protein
VKEKQLVALNRLTTLVNEEFDPAEAENIAKQLLGHKSKETCIYVEKIIINANTAQITIGLKQQHTRCIACHLDMGKYS